jgi:transposase
MPWTKITRIQYQRSGLRYASDLTDAEWALIARKMPRRRRLGRPRETDLREIVQAIFYILSTGCQWRALPSEFPPYSTVQGYFYAWRDTGRWHRIVRALVRQARRKLGRKPTPTAAVIDSQSASTTQAGGPRGFDPGKRVHGRKRHIVTDTNGLLLAVHVHPANVQDVHGAVPGALGRALSQASTRLCRPGLPRQTTSRSTLPLRRVDHRDCRATTRGQGLPALASTLGRRTHVCMVRQMPSSRQRLRGLRQHRSCLAFRRPSQTLNQTPCQALKMLLLFESDSEEREARLEG